MGEMGCSQGAPGPAGSQPREQVIVVQCCERRKDHNKRNDKSWPSVRSSQCSALC